MNGLGGERIRNRLDVDHFSASTAPASIRNKYSGVSYLIVFKKELAEFLAAA
jgi:hypothetical protein